MTTIHKFPLMLADEQTIRAPRGARPLAVQFQAGRLCLWVHVQPKNEPRDYRIRIYGTGHPLDESALWRYIGTAQQEGGRFVWHVFGEM